jgi:hypothetical protein
LGCNRGRVIIVLAKEAQIKRAIGIESERDLYQRALRAAHEQLTSDQFKKVDFWYGNFDVEGDEGEPKPDATDREIADHNQVDL